MPLVVSLGFMNTLPSTFTANDFDFTLVKRIGDVAMLSKQKFGHAATHYEVVIVQKHAETKWPDGRISPARESMPSSEQWGTCGWSPCDIKAAEERFIKALKLTQNREI